MSLENKETIENEKKACTNILLEGDLVLYKHKILNILWNEDLNGWIEILSRVGDNKQSPDMFFDKVTEETKLEFDFKVFREVLEQYKLWNLKYNNIHINIHPFTLTDKNFIQRLNNLFEEYNFTEFKKLSFEIVENGSISEIDELNKNIDLLREKEIRVWLDDYPNENNNNELLFSLENIDFVKIDKSFSLSIAVKGKEIIRDIIQQLITDIHKIHPGVKIVIEWVEDLECFEFLSKNIYGIDLVQWYLFWKPNEL